MKEIDYYAPADKAIALMNRDNLQAFGRLKMANFDQINVVQVVLKLYREQARKAKKRYREIGMEAYLMGLEMAGVDIRGPAGRRKAKKAITGDWIEMLMRETDFVTMYRFNTETERKAQRLIEGLSIAEDRTGGREIWQSPKETRDTLIDQALRSWSRQLGQYAINVTDAAVIQAMDDAEVEWVQWLTERDQRVCTDCHQLDGRVFRIDEVPAKPHWNCRCRVTPAANPGE